MALTVAVGGHHPIRARPPTDTCTGPTTTSTMVSMHVDARTTDLTAAPKARWALAWLAAPVAAEPHPLDFHDAATVRPRRTRLHPLRRNPAGLLAEVHTRVEDWRYQDDAHTEIDRLGPPDGYRRIATALARTPAARWWWQDLDRDHQTWICTDPGIRQGHGLPFGTGYAHHWDSTAPAQAMTTGTRLPGLPSTALLSDQNRPPARRTDPTRLSAWAARVSPDARVAEVHGPDDWIALVDRYPSHRTDLCNSPHLRRTWPDGALIWTIDWQRLAQDYDGLHLSVAGWLTATSRVLTVPGRGHTLCEGWPTEATRWFRPVFAGPFERLHPPVLEYGYGRPVAGSAVDLTRQPDPRPWWRRRPHLEPTA